MEKRQVGSMRRLCVIAFFFIISIVLLNHQKKKSVTATHIDSLDITAQSVIRLSIDQAYHHMNSLFVSHNTSLIVKVINQCMHQFTVELVEKIISDQTNPLSSEEKMNILFGTVAYCGPKKMIYYRLLDFLLEYPELQKNNPALFVLMRSAYVDSLPFFINWGKDRQIHTPHLLAKFIERAFEKAIDVNDYTVVENMFNKKIRLSRDKASQFLWRVVEKNKNHYFIPVLVKYGAADINYAQNGKTLLIEAVEQNNQAMVQVLLDQGAVVDRVIDPARGTALHIAMERQYKAAEILLREYGA